MRDISILVRRATICGAAIALLGLAGCGALQIRSGHMVDPAQLESALTVGTSSAQDVLRVLGEPMGKGREALPFGPVPRSIWSYNHEASIVDLGGDGSDSRRMYLLVFLRDEKFDGYLWFSSLLEHRRPQ
jgi:hypothetical protein